VLFTTLVFVALDSEWRSGYVTRLVLDIREIMVRFPVVASDFYSLRRFSPALGPHNLLHKGLVVGEEGGSFTGCKRPERKTDLSHLGPKLRTS
jgi:hypothetical protein